MKPTVLILGARGRFGLAAARAFSEADWNVLGQIRPGASACLAGVQWLPLDLADGAALAQAARGASVVVHALNPPYPQWGKQLPVLMEAAMGLAETLDATLMFPGNVYNYGASMLALLDEATPQRPSTRKGALRVAMEQRLIDSGVRSVVIRAGDYFGSGSGSWFDIALAKDIHKGKMTYPGAMDVATSWAYLPDLARSFVAVANRLTQDPAALPRHASFGFAGHQLRGSDWAALMQAVAQGRGWLAPGQRLKLGRMPWWLIHSLSFAVPIFRELSEMRYLWQTPYALSGDRLAAFIGVQPVTPLPQALRAALADLGK
ncbi:MAG: NAD-dependent epimerase/dehydratase family protein [Betaproteobacteria bacterium]